MTLEKNNDGVTTPDDPRVTAYAFGELEGAECALVEAAVAADPVLAARVAELRDFGGVLGAALAGELSETAARDVDAPSRREASGGRVLRFPAWGWTAAGFAAAASLALVLTWRENHPSTDAPELVRARPSVKPAAVPETPGVVFAVPPVEPVDVRRAPEVGSLLVKGREQYVAGDFDAATATFSAAESASPNNAEAGYYLGRIAAEREQVEALKQREGSFARLFGDVVIENEAALPQSGPAMFAMMPPPPSADAMAAPAPPPASAAPSDARRLESVAAMVRYRRVNHSESPPAEANVATGNESYAGISESGFADVASEPLSTFSIDVDTASYSNVRRFLSEGRLPPRDAVRIEELVNYFPYRYAGPTARDGAPFAANLAVVAAPWTPEHRLVRIGIKGRELSAETRPAANLVFLVDVSGSMSAENKLPLVKSSLRMLLGRLRADDRVAIVTYAGASGLALPSTPAERGGDILDALDRLESGGSTNGGMGIHLAYDIAKANFRPDGLNRVILCTDGDFNVGVTGREALLDLIQEKARSRVFLTVLGFGMGNLKDGTLEQLANKGNGSYGYIDSRREARKVFVEQVEGTLATIAKDVKIQVEFNPARVASYRLIGYENRALAKEDFNNDTVDAGDVGAGHTVTALYEIVPTGAADAQARPEVDELKYGPAGKRANAPRPVAEPGTGMSAQSDELLTVKIRYKAPDGDVSRKLEFPLVDAGAGFSSADSEFKFAAAVAGWGMLLRESPHAGAASWSDVLAWAEAGQGNDSEGHRAEFVELVRKARGLRE